MNDSLEDEFAKMDVRIDKLCETIYEMIHYDYCRLLAEIYIQSGESNGNGKELMREASSYSGWASAKIQYKIFATVNVNASL